jgi:hypothetical protein
MQEPWEQRLQETEEEAPVSRYHRTHAVREMLDLQEGKPEECESY